MLNCDPREKDEKYAQPNGPRFDSLTDPLPGVDGWLHCLARADERVYALRLMAVANRHFTDPAMRARAGCTLVILYKPVA